MIRKNILDNFETKLETNPILQGMELRGYYNDHKREIDAEFEANLRWILKKGAVLQKDKRIGQIEYISFSILQSSILDGRNEIRIDLYDKRYCLNTIECSVNWNAGFILKFIDDECDEFIGKNKIELKHIKQYERNYLKLKCVDVYEELIYMFLRVNLDLMLKLIEDEKVQITESLKIVLGGYLDNIDFVINE